MKLWKFQPNRVGIVWLLAGGYLIYLAARLIISVIKGEASSTILAVGAAILFLAVAAFLFYREWKNYQKRGQEELEAQEDLEDLDAFMDEQSALPESSENLDSGEGDSGVEE